MLNVLHTLRSHVRHVRLSAYQCNSALRALIAEILRHGSLGAAGVRSAPPRLRGLLCVSLLHFLKCVASNDTLFFFFCGCGLFVCLFVWLVCWLFPCGVWSAVVWY